MQFLDIVQERNLGLMRAIENYDSSKSSFTTYAKLWIERTIYREFNNKKDLIRKPIF